MPSGEEGRLHDSPWGSSGRAATVEKDERDHRTETGPVLRELPRPGALPLGLFYTETTCLRADGLGERRADEPEAG